MPHRYTRLHFRRSTRDFFGESGDGRLCGVLLVELLARDVRVDYGSELPFGVEELKVHLFVSRSMVSVGREN